MYTWIKIRKMIKKKFFSFVLIFQQKKKMFEKVLSFVCCCFPTLTSATAPSSTKHKHHSYNEDKTAFIISCRKLKTSNKKKSPQR
jgi:hypothetical protein